jgi:hypothetical protein
MKKKDTEVMKLRGKVMESREEYFSNMTRLDATLTKKKEEEAKKSSEYADLGSTLLLNLNVRRKSCDYNRTSPNKSRESPVKY